jgi:hypothetical protein
MTVPQTFEKNTSIFVYLKKNTTAGFRLCYFLDRRNCAAKAHWSISSILNPFLYLDRTWRKHENSTLVGTSEGRKNPQNNVWILLYPTSLRTQHWVTDTLETLQFDGCALYHFNNFVFCDIWCVFNLKWEWCFDQREQLVWYKGNLGTRRRWAVSFATWWLYSRRKENCTQWTGDWMGPRAVLDNAERENFLPLPGIKPQFVGRPTSAALKLIKRSSIYGSITSFESEAITFCQRKIIKFE